MPAIKKVADINLGSEAFSVWTDIAALRKQVRSFRNVGVGRANMRALQRSANKTKTLTGRLLAKDFNIKVGDIGKFLYVSPRPTMTSNTTAIAGKSSQLGIYKYAKGAKKQGPLGVKFNSGGGSKVHPHTFIARMPSGHIGVFVRKHKRGGKRVVGVSPTTGKAYKGQHPIRELTYPSVAHMVTNTKRGRVIFEAFVNEYPKQLFSQLDFEQKKSRGRG